MQTMTPYHVLNGDCLAERLRQTSINQDFIVCRECLIVGELSADNLSEFWVKRAQFISKSYQVTPELYFTNTVAELNKLDNIPPNSEVCLWFENDLFCQTNLWFVLSLLADRSDLNLYRVFPIITNEADRWKGFGKATPESLEQAYISKVLFTPKDIELGNRLWEAYQNSDFDRLTSLSKEQSACFEYLEEVCLAHLDRFPSDGSLGRPEKVVKEIIATHADDFPTVFSLFSQSEGIYGFGDDQIKSIYDKLI